MAVVNPTPTTRQQRVVASAILTVVVVVTVLMWGPVARGLHEESVMRWCSAAQGVTGVEVHGDRALQIGPCVEQALTDPAFMTALRASL